MTPREALARALQGPELELSPDIAPGVAGVLMDDLRAAGFVLVPLGPIERLRQAKAARRMAMKGSGSARIAADEDLMHAYNGLAAIAKAEGDEPS